MRLAFRFGFNTVEAELVFPVGAAHGGAKRGTVLFEISCARGGVVPRLCIRGFPPDRALQ